MSTKEEDNFLRIVYLNYQVATVALRNYFDRKHPNLASDLFSNKKILQDLFKPPPYKKRILYPAQWNILYPPQGSKAVSSADLDVTLMVCLLRNLPPTVLPPPKGFDVLPQSSDTSDGDHIARIKYYKNALVSHSTNCKLSDADFASTWNDLEMAIHGLGNHQDSIDATAAKSRILDYNSVKRLMYRHEILNQRLEDQATKISKLETVNIQQNRKRLNDQTKSAYILQKHSSKMAKLETTVENMETDRQSTKKDCNDFMIRKLQQWGKEDQEYFVETTAYNHVMCCLLNNKCVSVVGPPGVGKTFLVQHVALEMEKIGFYVISVRNPNEIKQKYMCNRKLLFVVDDMCGNFTANTTRLDLWKDGVKDLTYILDKDVYKMDVHFSHHCGENIELSEEKQKASWDHKYSGGIAFSSQPLRPNSKLKLDLTGTGHAYVGIIKRDPASVTNMRKALTSDVIVATEVKVHKRLGAVNIVSDTKDGKDCISFESYNGTKTVDINSEVWLFLYIKFGDMIAVLHSESIQDRCFHHVTGCNIRCLDEDRRSAKLLVENPAAVCCLNKKMKPGHSVTFETKAITENRNKPSQCHIKLGIINLDPSELKSRDPESFQVDSKVACPSRWNIVQIFSKENVDGELKLYLTHTGELYFSHDSGIDGTHKCHSNETSSGITIILDLFRAEASVSDYHHEESNECEEKDYDYVRPEVEISEIIKIKLQISDKQHEKECSSSDRSSSDSDYLQMKDVSDNHKTFSPNCKISPRLTRCGMYRKDQSSSNFQECK